MFDEVHVLLDVIQGPFESSLSLDVVALLGDHVMAVLIEFRRLHGPGVEPDEEGINERRVNIRGVVSHAPRMNTAHQHVADGYINLLPRQALKLRDFIVRC